MYPVTINSEEELLELFQSAFASILEDQEASIQIISSFGNTSEEAKDAVMKGLEQVARAWIHRNDPVSVLLQVEALARLDHEIRARSASTG